MLKTKELNKILLVVITLFNLEIVLAQVVFSENFEFDSNGSSIGGYNGWVQSSAEASGCNPIKTSSTGLSFPNYINSGIGNSVYNYCYNNSTGLYTHTFPSLSTIDSDIYFAFLYKSFEQPSTITDGQKNFWLTGLNSSGSTVNHYIFVAESSNSIQFGFTTGSAGGNYGALKTPWDDTYLVVVNFTPTQMKMWVFNSNESIPSSPPTSTYKTVNYSMSSIHAIRLTACCTDNVGNYTDGLRVGKGWSDVLFGPTEWIGLGGDNLWSTSANWSNGLPNIHRSALLTNANGTDTVFMDTDVSIPHLTINSGAKLVLNSDQELLVSGSIENNGLLKINQNSTLVQGSAGTCSGSGTYTVKQDITGSNSSGTPNGRGWYMGSPVSGATSNLFAPSASTNLIYHWKADQATPAWQPLTAGSASSLDVGKGYAVRVGESSSTITFSSATLNNAPSTAPITIPCYKQSSSTYQGYNLVSNPFPSYLDWNDVWTGTNASNFENTIYYRVANGSNEMVFDTYNAETGLSTNTSGSYATRYIPPMQGFWVKVASGVSASSNAVDLSLTNSMRDHYTAVTNGWSSGLKSTAQDYSKFLRLNLEQGTFKDQIAVFLSDAASSQLDGYDSEKMMLNGYPQIYTEVSGKKLVFNGLRENKRVMQIPVVLTLPSPGTFQLKAEELHAAEGFILLEDRLEGIIQDLSQNDTYIFSSGSGTISNRFYIRFQQISPSITSTDVQDEWVDAQEEINTGGEVLVVSKNQGILSVIQNIDPTPNNNSRVVIRDAAGRIQCSGVLTGLESEFVLDVPSGVYIVEVQLHDQLEIKKIFVQQ